MPRVPTCPAFCASGRLTPAFVAGTMQKSVFDRPSVEAVLAQYPAIKFHHRNARPVGFTKAVSQVDIKYLYRGPPANQGQKFVEQQFA